LQDGKKLQRTMKEIKSAISPKQTLNVIGKRAESGISLQVLGLPLMSAKAAIPGLSPRVRKNRNAEP